MDFSGYSDTHRMFLQGLMSRAIVRKADARAILRQILKLQDIKGKIEPGDVTTVIDSVNSKIRPLSMEIKIVRSEEDGEEFYVLVNTLDNSSTMEKIGHIYSPQGREVFRKILEMIVESDTYGSVSTTDCLNMNCAGLKPGDIQALKDNLVDDQWFVVEKNGGNLCPAPRCIAEFENYFKQNFRDHVSICLVCDGVVFRGFNCDNCSTITHRHCFIHINKDKDSSKCPNCKAVIREAVQLPRNRNHSEDTSDTPRSQRKKSRSSNSSNTLDTTIENTPATSGGSRKRLRD